MNMIEIKNLNKSFKEIHAVQDLTFSVKKGEFFAFLGVNGAGKSTTINMICAELKKDGGEIIIGGKKLEEDPDGIRSGLGVVFQSSTLDRALSVRDTLESRAALYGIYGADFEKKLASTAELLDFGDLLSRRVGKLSGGQRRRVDIARALLGDPKILILDEPTTGLDPQSRKTLWAAVENLRKNEEMTVFLTTHYMEEAAGADHVVIIDKGQIVAEGTPLELKNRYTADCIILFDVSEAEVSVLGVPFKRAKDAFVISVDSPARATELIVAHPEIFRDYEIIKGKMDDVFLAATGKMLEGGEVK